MYYFLDSIDPSIELYPSDYCSIVNQITKNACFETSLLEMWSSDNYGPETGEAIRSLTREQILDGVNAESGSSQVFKRPTDFSSYLGGIERDSSGRIVSAKATYIRFFGRINASAISEDERRTANSNKGKPVSRP